MDAVTASLKVRVLLGRRALDNAINTLGQGVVILDESGIVISVNEAFTSITGYVLNDFDGKSYGQLLNGPKTNKNTIGQMDLAYIDLAHFAGEILHYRKGGAAFWNELSISPIFNKRKDICNFIITMRDISDRIKIDDKTKKLAFFDQLTNLPNRNLCLDRLNQALVQSKRSALYGALLFIDIDNLKFINDQYGHEAGDLLLTEFAKRISNGLRARDTSSRFGGDEFVVILNEFTNNYSETACQVSDIAKKILARLSSKYIFTITHPTLGDNLIQFESSASIGATLFLGNQIKSSNIIKRADMAMYEAKKMGGNQVRFYAP
ncbi:MAG: diguanylate cyclase domain-containing protein [Polynucleobacter sp.]